MKCRVQNRKINGLLKDEYRPLRKLNAFAYDYRILVLLSGMF
jgi:hypothetical protein